MGNHFTELCSLINSAITYVEKEQTEDSKILCKKLQCWTTLLSSVLTAEDIEKSEILKNKK